VRFLTQHALVVGQFCQVKELTTPETAHMATVGIVRRSEQGQKTLRICLLEEELSTSHGLARGTVRRALGRIEDLGMINRRPGAGTIVISPVPVAGYQPLAQSAVDILTLAAETRLVNPNAAEVILDATRAKRLGARKGSTWFVIEGVRALRKGNGTPLCWSEQYLPGDFPRDKLLRADFTLEEVAAQPVEQIVTASVLDGQMSLALDAGPGSAALVITRRHLDTRGRLVSVGIHTHPADRYSIRTTL
jgi:DNA-binding GntR family transcriptional regulator